MRQMRQGLLVAVCLLLILALTPITAGAWVGREFASGNLLYQVTSESGTTGTVKVVTWGVGGHPGGAISVPDTVTDSGITYTVTWIENWIWDLSTTGITSIDMTAMQNLTRLEFGVRQCNALQEIKLPPSLISVGDNAFWNMPNLRTVDFSACVNFTTLGLGVFVNAPALQYVDFRNTLLTVIPDYTFSNTPSLVTVYMPTTLLSINQNAFDRSGIQTLDLTHTNLHDIGGWAFIYSHLQSISFPASLHLIGENAFEACAQLTTVTFADDNELEIIGQFAFYGATALVNINLDALGPDLIDIGRSAFEFTAMQIVDLSNATSLTRICQWTFFQMENLTDVILPESLLAIDNNAFEGAVNLETVTFLSMEPPTIDPTSFIGVPAVGIVYYPHGATEYTSENFAHTQLVMWFFRPIEIPPTEYNIIKGADQSWRKGTQTGAAMTSDGPVSKFIEVKIDGVVIDPSKYTVTSDAQGNTIITFKPAFLETLKLGSHTVELVFTDGSASTTLTILPRNGGGGNGNGNGNGGGGGNGGNGGGNGNGSGNGSGSGPGNGPGTTTPPMGDTSIGYLLIPTL